MARKARRPWLNCRERPEPSRISDVLSSRKKLFYRSLSIILTAKAAKDLDGLEAKAREQISEGLYRYAMTGEGEVKRLSGRDGYRLRIGRYRVMFDEDQTTIIAIYIGTRETNTYRRN